MSETNKPVKKFRAGHIEVAIWENQVELPDRSYTSYSVTMKKTTKVNEEWEETTSLFANELPIVDMLLHYAYCWIYIDRKNEKDSGPT